MPGVSALFTNMPALISSPDSMVSFLEVVGLHLPSTPVVSVSECHSLALSFQRNRGGFPLKTVGTSLLPGYPSFDSDDKCTIFLSEAGNGQKPSESFTFSEQTMERWLLVLLELPAKRLTVLRLATI